MEGPQHEQLAAPERRRIIRRGEDPGYVPPAAIATTDSLKVRIPAIGELNVTGQFIIIVIGLAAIGASINWQGHLAALDADHIVGNQHIIMDRETIVMNTMAICTGAEHLKAQFEATERRREQAKAKRDKRQ